MATSTALLVLAELSPLQYPGNHGDIGAMALEADGSVLIAGNAWADSNSQQIAVAHVKSVGSLDGSFGSNGWSLIGQTGQSGLADSVVPLSDGHVLIGGRVTVSNNTQTALIRLNSNGAVDSTFGTNGQRAEPLFTDGPYRLVEQTPGKILATGQASGGAGVGAVFSTPTDRWTRASAQVA